MAKDLAKAFGSFSVSMKASESLSGHRSEDIQVDIIRKKLVFQVTLDVSGSMSGKPLESASRALMAIYSEDMEDEDMFGLTTFADEVTQHHRAMSKSKVKFQKDIEHIKKAAEKGCCTALYDGITHDIKALRKLEPWIRQELGYDRVVAAHLVITDGADNSSKTSSLAEVEKLLKNPNVQGYHLYIIGAGLDGVSHRLMSRLCEENSKFATFFPVGGVDTREFHDVIENLRKCIKVLLNISDINVKEIISTEIDASNYRVVLNMLATRSEIVAKQLPTLMASFQRLLLKGSK